MDHPVEPIKGGKTRRRHMLEIGEDIVLDDDQAGSLGQFQQAMRRDRREHGACGIVDRRIGDVEPRLVPLESLTEQLYIRPRRREGHADDVDAMRTQERMEIEIAGIVDQHGIAGLDEETAEKIDRMRSGFRQHDLVRPHCDAMIAEASCQQLPQWRQAERRSVIGKHAHIPSRQRSQRAPQSRLR